MHACIYSFIHSGHFYSASSSPLLLRGAHDYSTDTVSGFHAEAPQAWWGFTTAQDRDRLERLMGRLRRGFFLPAQDRSFGDLAAEADRKLFRAVVTGPRHVLSRLLPEVK